jgi:hypothetical protein
MIEIRNKNTGQVRLVPAETAKAVREQKWLIKQGWEVVEHRPPPYEVIQFQENKEGTVKVLTPEPIVNTSPTVTTTADLIKQDLSTLSVKKIAAQIQEFTQEELKILVDDPRKSVSQMAKKWIRSS